MPESSVAQIEKDILEKWKIVDIINSVSRVNISREEFLNILLTYFSQSISADYALFAVKDKSGAFRVTESYQVEANGTIFDSSAEFQDWLETDEGYLILPVAENKKKIIKYFPFIPYKEIASKNLLIIQSENDVSTDQKKKVVQSLIVMIIPTTQNLHNVYFVRLMASYYAGQLREKIFVESLQKKRFEERAYKRFFNTSICQKLEQSKTDVGRFERKEIVSMFVDIRDFTSFAGQSNLDTLHSYMTEYRRWLINSLEAFDGTLDNFLGDGLFAFWGAPLGNYLFGKKALDFAISLMKSFKAKQNNNDFPAEWGLGIGMAYGEAVVGGIKAANGELEQYTAIGQSVKLASSLSDIASNEVIVSQEYYEELDNPKGFSRKVGPLHGYKEDVNYYTCIIT